MSRVYELGGPMTEVSEEKEHYYDALEYAQAFGIKPTQIQLPKSVFAKLIDRAGNQVHQIDAVPYPAPRHLLLADPGHSQRNKTFMFISDVYQGSGARKVLVGALYKEVQS